MASVLHATLPMLPIHALNIKCTRGGVVIRRLWSHQRETLLLGYTHTRYSEQRYNEVEVYHK